MAKKGKKGAEQPPAEETRSRPPAVAAGGSNIPDDTVRKHVEVARQNKRELKQRQDKVKEANGIYRAGLKEAEAQGVDPSIIIWYLKQAERDPRDVEREMRLCNRYARIMGLPVGTQLGLFEDGTSVAERVDAEKLAAAKASEVTPQKTYQEGYAAGLAGRPWDICPYAEDTDQRQTYLTGWERGQFENAGKIKPTADRQPISLDPEPGADEVGVLEEADAIEG